MEGIIRLEDFYRSLKKNIYDNIITLGHFDLLKVEDLPTFSKQAGYLRRTYHKVSLVYGNSKIHYPGKSFEINGAALVFTNPKMPYQWEKISSNQEGHVCIFTSDFLAPLANPDDFIVYQSVDCSVIPLNKHLADKMENMFREMTEELKSSYHQKYDLLRYMLLELLHQGQKNAPAHPRHPVGSNANERLTVLFLELLERQFPIENSAQKIVFFSPGLFADTLNVHVNHLNKALRQVTGSSTSSLINRRLMLEAKNLLKGTNWPIYEISSALSFDEPNHFSAFFKRHEGINPAGFRSQLD